MASSPECILIWCLYRQGRDRTVSGTCIYIISYLRDRGRCVDGPSGPRQSRRLSIRLMKWARFFRGLGGRGRRTEDSSTFCDSLPPHSSHFYSWLLSQSLFLYSVFISRDVTELYVSGHLCTYKGQIQWANLVEY